MTAPHIEVVFDWPKNTDTPENFSTKAEVAGLSLNDFSGQTNIVADFINERSDHAELMADDATQSATEAQGWAAAAQNAANIDATLWDPDVFYLIGNCVFVNEPGYGGTIYRRLSDGQSSEKPYVDRVNWDPIDVSQYGWGSTQLATYPDANTIPGRNMRSYMPSGTLNMPMAVDCILDQIYESDARSVQVAYAVDGSGRYWNRIKAASVWTPWRIESNMNLYSVSSTGACDLREAAYFVISVNAATTVSITNAMGGTTWAQFFSIELVFGSTLFAVTWPPSVKWSNNVQPNYAINKRYKIGLEWSPSAQVWHAAFLGGY